MRAEAPTTATGAPSLDARYRRRWSLIGHRLLAGVVAVALLLWVARSVSLREAWSVLERLDTEAVCALLLANMVVLLALNGRWWLLLRAQGLYLSYLHLVAHRLAAFAVSYLTPGPQFGGEPLQVALLERRHQVPRPQAVATVALDRLFELLANFSFLLAALLVLTRFSPLSALVGAPAVAAVGVLLTLPLAVMALVAGGRRPFSGLLRRLRIPRWPRWRSARRRLLASTRAAELTATGLLRRPSTIWRVTVVSLLAWVALMGEHWLLLSLLGLQVNLLQALAALTAARVAFLLPVPAGLGSLEASQVLVLGAMGIDPAAGLSVSLVIRARDALLAGLGLGWASSVGWDSKRESPF